MERGRRGNGFLDGGVHRLGGGEIEEVEADGGVATIAVESSPPPTASASSPRMSSCGQYILHRVGRFDTLAGVAIKYGVEVADVKRLNGLATDLQMFAHKTLRIPLPGRHPPSCLLNSSPETDNRERTPPRRPHNDVLDSFLKPPRHSVSPAMSLLQGYYGLAPPPKREPGREGTEMAVYRKGKPVCLDDGPWLREAPNSEPLPSQHRKTRSLMGGFSLVNGNATEENGDSDRSIRRRQKVDAELLPRDENGGGFLARAGEGLALRPKSGNRPDMNKSQQNLSAIGEPSFGDGLQTVRKSSSTPDFQESDSNSSSIWPTGKWSLKADAFTLPLPLFDGLPKQIAAWRNKAARD